MHKVYHKTQGINWFKSWFFVIRWAFYGKKKYKNVVFCLFISEKGGLEEKLTDSYVRIVCDFEGGKVLPLFKVKKEYRANLSHAYFKGYDLCTVEIFYENQKSMFRIKHFTIDKYTGEFFEETLYEGRLKHRINMPRKLKRFDAALDAACEKIKDSQCTRIYYSLVQEAEGRRK